MSADACSVAVKNMASFVSGLKEQEVGTKIVGLNRTLMLTNPSTHLSNIVGNLSRAALMIADDVPGAIVDTLVSAVSGTPRTIAMPNPMAYVKGLTGKGVEQAGKALRGLDINGNKYEGGKLHYDNAIFESASQVVFRSLQAGDALFWEGAYRYSLDNLARVEAKNAGLGREGVKRLMDTPTDAMHLEASYFADVATFKNRNAAAEMWSKGMSGLEANVAMGREAREALRTGAGKGSRKSIQENRILSKVGKGSAVVKFAAETTVPFVKVPTNIAGATLSYTPFGFAYTLLENVGDPNRKELIRGLARLGTGSAIAYIGYLLAEEGLIKGPVSAGPNGQRERQALVSEGAQENSVMVNGTWVDVSKVAPGGTLLAIGAHLHRMAQEGKQNPWLAGGTEIAREAADSSWLGGLSDLGEQVNSGFQGKPGEGVGALLGQRVGSVVPNVVASGARGADPYERDMKGEGFMESFQNQLKSKVPGLRQQLPPKLDSFGQPIQDGRGVVSALVSPLRTRRVPHDDTTAAAAEAARLGIHISGANKTYVVDEEERELTPAQQRRYTGVQGKYVRDAIKSLLKDASYWKLSDEEKKKEMKTAIGDAKKEAREAELSNVLGIR